MDTNNDNFPRGGRRISNTTQNKRKNDSLFSTEKPAKKVKKSSKEKNSQKDFSEDSWQASLNFQGTLTYKKMQQGMVVLGCIRRITNLTLQIEFPGLTFGQVTINRISDPFTTLLTENLQESSSESPNASLKDIFKLGQLIPIKILSIESKEKGYDVQGSINPKDINADKMHYSFIKGTTIWATVLSELDHGYELSIGVKNCRVFLPFKNIDDSKKYVKGECLYCIIHKAESSNIATTLTVSAKQEHVDKVQIKEDYNLRNLIPGTKVAFFVEKILPHGIRGHFLENCLGYLDETQIFSKINTERITEGFSLPAYVLFVEPITKATYLTLRGFYNIPEPKYELGKIMTAEVQSDVSNGLYLKLGKEDTGFVTTKRLLNTLPKDAALNIVDAVKKKYPLGSRHSCRILDYNRMQQLYICTFEQKLIKEKIFNVEDLKLGQSVTVMVDKIIPKGLVVKAGHIQGFVPNLHLSQVKYSDNIKKKFSIKMTVNARVLNIINNSVVFTLKQGLVESDKCLTTIKDISLNSQYVGFVIQTKLSGALIAFYGNAKGWISNRILNAGNSGRYTDPRDYFFIGQVVTVWTVGFKNEKLQLSIIPPENIHKKKIKIGEKLSGRVTSVHAKGVDVEVGKFNTDATIPLVHLTNNPFLCSPLSKTYKVGQQLRNLMCIKNDGIPIMSRRECVAYKKLNVPKFCELKKNMILRCSFEETTELGIYVSTPIADFQDNIEILNKNMFSKHDDSFPTFEKNQCILTKILKVNYSTKNITLSAKRNHISDINLDTILNLLTRDLEDIDSIIHFGQENKWNLTQYKIGERVECTIQKIDQEGNCTVVLSDGTEGLITARLCSLNNQIGDVVEAVVLDYNFNDDRLELCCKNDIRQKINKLQDGIIKKSFMSSCLVEILLLTKCYALGVLKDHHCNRQLVYLPIYFNENDDGIKSLYEEKKLKILLYRRINNRIVGLPKKLAVVLEKAIKRKEKQQNEDKIMKTNDCASKMETSEDNLERPMKEVEDDSEDVVSEMSEDDVTDNNLQDEINDTSEQEDINEHMEQDEEEIESSEQCSDNKILLNEISEEENVSEVTDLDEEYNDDDDDDDYDDDDDDNDDDDDGDDDDDTLKIENKSKSVRSEGSKGTEALLSGVNSFYITEGNIQDESSSDEEAEHKNHSKKKKKLTPAERAEIAKKEEERISKIEKELADATAAPQSAEQFDRLLLANPNSSELWLKYMAMHVAATELEKARAVGKKALETINMTLIPEKFNIWIALLNLENMYGTKESFEKLFEEAVKFNDSLEIYLNVIKLFATSGKLVEMEEKIKKVRSKEKQSVKMWLEVGQIYYSLGKFKEARNIKEAALKSILDKKRQFDLIVRFGIMEFQSGDLEHAIANFETILETYPAKINIWIIYVDQLIKKNKIDLARKLLERAVGQKFAAKSMKTIFQKFINFEEQYGTAESVSQVKQKAKEYVNFIGAR